MGYQLTEAEERLAEILWKHVPMSSAELVKICGEEMDWKKSTTYTTVSYTHLPQLSGGQLHTDGGKHRLCHRYFQPVYGTEKTDAPSQSHHSGIESGISDHHYIWFHAGDVYKRQVFGYLEKEEGEA